MELQNMVKGEDLFLYILENDPNAAEGTDFNVIAFATSCELSVDGETVDTSNKMSCRWNAAMAGKNSYSISADALYTRQDGAYSFDYLLDIMLGKYGVKWAIGPYTEKEGGCEAQDFKLDTSKIYYTGVGLITSLSLSAGNGEIASSSISITGSGELEHKGYKE